MWRESEIALSPPVSISVQFPRILPGPANAAHPAPDSRRTRAHGYSIQWDSLGGVVNLPSYNELHSIFINVVACEAS